MIRDRELTIAGYPCELYIESDEDGQETWFIITAGGDIGREVATELTEKRAMREAESYITQHLEVGR